jgi:3-methyladenine DNA glycosylase AlkD
MEITIRKELPLNTMTSQQLIADIRSFCIANANEANVLKYSRYFKGDLYNGYGLSAPQIYAETKELLKIQEMTLQLVLDAASDIIKYGKSEEITLIMLMVKGLHKHYSRDTFTNIEAWYSYGINNWAHADNMGMLILPAFLNKGIVEITDFKNWLKADNKFQRRSVPVTLIKSLKTHAHYAELFFFIECLMTDPEREVHQGTGWFLREAWKRKPEETESFLLKWKDISPRLIFQYATEKMTAEGKVKFKREQKTKIKD